MSEAPVSLAFFDPARRLHGMARRELTLLFRGATPQALDAGPQLEHRDGRYRAVVGEELDLAFDPLADAVQLAGARVTLCRVSGSVEGASIDALGTASETLSPPRWEDLDALRAVSALFDAGHAVLAAARRPRGAAGHGQELVSATLIDGGELRDVEEARISTVYDGEARQRSATLELWLPGEDFPRRMAGTLAAGTTLELPGLRVNASVFSWTMEGREGAGAYELTVRDEPPEAA